MSTGQEELIEKINYFRRICTESSRLAGLARATKELSSNSIGIERTYMKLSFISFFNSLILSLNVLTEDSKSKIKIRDLTDAFEKKFGGKLKIDINRYNKYLEYRNKLNCYHESIISWKSIRNNVIAHRNLNYKEEWSLDIITISNFIRDVIDLINIIIDITNLPENYINSTYINKIAINLENNIYKETVANLKYINTN